MRGLHIRRIAVTAITAHKYPFDVRWPDLLYRDTRIPTELDGVDHDQRPGWGSTQSRRTSPQGTGLALQHYPAKVSNDAQAVQAPHLGICLHTQ